VHTELATDFVQRFVAPDFLQRHLGLELCREFVAFLLAHNLTLFSGKLPP
jgi:hypothetical protein